MLTRKQSKLEQANYLQAVAHLHHAVAALRMTRNQHGDSLLGICAHLIAEAENAKLNHDVDAPGQQALTENLFFSQKAHNYMAASYGVMLVDINNAPLIGPGDVS